MLAPNMRYPQYTQPYHQAVPAHGAAQVPQGGCFPQLVVTDALTVRDVRERVEQISCEAKMHMGHWGRNAGKYLNWTLVGAPIGVHAVNKAAARVRANMPSQFAELTRIAGAIEAVPAQSRTKAQKALLHRTQATLRKFNPTARTHVMQGVAAGFILLAAGAEGAANDVAISHGGYIIDNQPILYAGQSRYPRRVPARLGDGEPARL